MSNPPIIPTTSIIRDMRVRSESTKSYGDQFSS